MLGNVLRDWTDPEKVVRQIVWISHCNRCAWEQIDLAPHETLCPRCGRLPWHRRLTPDESTLREIYLRLVREFLGLPAEAQPEARWHLCKGFAVDRTMAYLQDALLPVEKQRMEHNDWPLRLTANRGRWRDGVTVVC